MNHGSAGRSEAPPELNGYTFIRTLGSGGYSHVHLYEAQMPQRPVAVKVLKESDLSDTVQRQFRAEANTMASLADHPYIVPVIDANVAADGRPYIVMMYCPRDNLAIQASRERFTVERALSIGIKIASAVHTAHRAKVLHRDIKPANILTDQYETPRLTDFGIAAQFGSIDDDDDTGISVPWSPPEVLYATEAPSVRADVYSLAATIWHLLVGRSPFEVASGSNAPLELMGRIRALPVPATGRADVPSSLERLLMQSMAKSPTARPASAMEFARGLQAVEQEQRFQRTEIRVIDDEPRFTRAQPEPSQSDSTRLRGPVRPIPSGPKSGEQRAGFVPPRPDPEFAPPGPKSRDRDQSTARRAPVAPSPSSSRTRTPGPRLREEDHTVLRPAAPRSTHSEPERKTPGKLFALALALLVTTVVVVTAAVIAHSSGSSKPPSPAPTTADDFDQNVGLPSALTITGTRVSAATVTFTWKYDGQQPGDKYRVKLNGQPVPDVVLTDPTFAVPSTAGTQECLQVLVIRANGTTGTSFAPDDPQCTP